MNVVGDTHLPVEEGRIDEAAEVVRVLDRVREHLGMDIAFLSAFTVGTQLVVATSERTGPMDVIAGDSRDLADTYCLRVAHGELPAAIPAARRHPVTRDLPVTADLGIGAYIGAPLRGPDGRPVGMLCCLNRGENPMLDADAVNVMKLAAALVEDRVGVFGLPHPVAAVERVQQIRRIIDRQDVRMALQPIVRLGTRGVVAVEALARFDQQWFPNPSTAFAAAASGGHGVDLELLAARAALSRLDHIPEDAWLGINLSADALLDPRAAELLLPHGPRVGVEITEHAPVADYEPLVAVTDRLKHAGVHVVVDDAGAGFASLKHVLRLRPTAIKLDIELIRDIDTDPVRQALVRSVEQFSGALAAWLVAEGVESETERQTLLDLGVTYGQGYLFGKPAWELSGV
ncbi:EAL domain-containing protein [Cellulomonas sp. RIT-PI-Y]|uniref:sensor domain-containing phosphodiesterase n=1 Tax=Cellulomonas sp. RIT-PI-Y TaxID=3035297 RepID=UPI0021D9615B|nr:EAL domain-containing protein [Cellulomonas sp. RIT-PI-Y]